MILQKEKKPLHAALDNQVSRVNSTLRSIRGVQVWDFFFPLSFQNFLLAAVKRLIYNQSVSHSSFSPSLPNLFLKDCTGEYTGSIKPF